MAFIKGRRAPITKRWEVKDSPTKADAEGITELNGRENRAVGIGGKNLQPVAGMRSTAKDTGMERIIVIKAIQDGLKTHLQGCVAEKPLGSLSSMRAGLVGGKFKWF